MMDVLPFSPDRSAPDRIRQARKIAAYLRDMADAIESDIVEVEPEALIVVLIGADKNDISWRGIKRDSQLLSAISDLRVESMNRTTKKVSS